MSPSQKCWSALKILSKRKRSEQEIYVVLRGNTSSSPNSVPIKSILPLNWFRNRQSQAQIFNVHDSSANWHSMCRLQMSSHDSPNGFLCLSQLLLCGLETWGRCIAKNSEKCYFWKSWKASNHGSDAKFPLETTFWNTVLITRPAGSLDMELLKFEDWNNWKKKRKTKTVSKQLCYITIWTNLNCFQFSSYVSITTKVVRRFNVISQSDEIVNKFSIFGGPGNDQISFSSVVAVGEGPLYFDSSKWKTIKIWVWFNWALEWVNWSFAIKIDQNAIFLKNLTTRVNCYGELRKTWESKIFEPLITCKRPFEVHQRNNALKHQKFSLRTLPRIQFCVIMMVNTLILLTLDWSKRIFLPVIFLRCLSATLPASSNFAISCV